MRSERLEVLKAVQDEVWSSLRVLQVESESMARRGHANWVLDARALPVGNHYVPVFTHLLEQLEREETIDPDRDILVETTTGNAGVAIAYLARLLGYSVIVFIPEDMPNRRLEEITRHLPDDGVSRIVRTSPRRYVEGMVHDFRRYLAQHRAGIAGKELVPIDHSRRSESIDAIRAVAGRALALLDATPTDVVLALGNGTSATGVIQASRQLNPGVRTVGVEPVESPWVFVQKYGEQRYLELFGVLPDFHPHHLIGTGGWGVRFPHIQIDLIDTIELVAEDQWRGQLSSLVRRGVTVGPTSAACQSVVCQMSRLREQEPDLVFFSMFYDCLSPYSDEH